MGGKPHGFGAKPKRPSPLQQVYHSRPLSQLPDSLISPHAEGRPEITLSTLPPTSGLVRDPMFWKRFSIAVHLTEEVKSDEETGNKSMRSNSVESKYGNEWLETQRREQRRCKINCAVITAAVMAVIIAAAICGWYFTNHNSKESTTGS